MEILYLLVPLSVTLVFVIAVVFWYAVKSGQFDDLEGPAHRILMDDDSPAATTSHPTGEFDLDQK
jgi:cbb3-type cytochrome oxidase maturation protein